MWIRAAGEGAGGPVSLSGHATSEQAGHSVRCEKGTAVGRLISRFREFLVSEAGVTATEYAVMLALITLVCLAAVGALGESVSDLFVTASEVSG